MIYREKVFHATNGNVAQLIYKQKKEKKVHFSFPERRQFIGNFY